MAAQCQDGGLEEIGHGWGCVHVCWRCFCICGCRFWRCVRTRPGAVHPGARRTDNNKQKKVLRTDNNKQKKVRQHWEFGTVCFARTLCVIYSIKQSRYPHTARDCWLCRCAS
jgi:hypothetical protein